MDKDNVNKYFIIALLLILSYLSFAILQGFLISIFLGSVIAYVIYPVYSRLVERTGSRRASALILSTFVVGVIVLVLILAVPQVVTESGKFYRIYQNALPGFFEDLSHCNRASDDLKCQAFVFLTDNVDSQTLSNAASSIAKPASDYLMSNIVAFFENLPGLFLQFTVILFSTFYFLNNGETIVKQVMAAMPLKTAYKKRINKRIDDVLKAVIYGNLLTAFLEGVAAAILFYALGINMALIAGVLIMFFALIPPLGAMIIWAPAVIVLVLIKEYVKAGLLAVACFIIFGYTDNIARPMIISRGVKLSSFWVLLGVFGGLSAFGFVGLIVGPLILALFVTFVKLAGEELSGAGEEEIHRIEYYGD
jgi:predicted PurR-regulated permease PerM